MAMMAITTNNSISVKPRCLLNPEARCVMADPRVTMEHGKDKQSGS
jgi:hypothetical protein